MTGDANRLRAELSAQQGAARQTEEGGGGMTRYIVSVSGGKDSTALYLWAKEQFGADGYEAVFADTGHEAPGTYAYVEALPQMAGGPAVSFVRADFGAQLARKGIQPTGVPFLDLAMWKGRFPSATAQFCTHELKLLPIKAWLESTEDGRDVTMLAGIRAGESARRAKLPEREFSDYFGCDLWRPLIAWTEAQVWTMLERHGVPPNPLYEAGFRRVGCFPCIYARKGELARLPDWAWDRLKEWERVTGKTFFSADKTPYEGLSTADQVARWAKTAKGGYQLDMFPEEGADIPQCVATWGTCE